MGNTTEAGERWSSGQVYALAILCLVIGIPVGYLFHAPPASSVNQPVSAGAQAAAPSSAAQPAQITPAQLAHMADKQAEPLLAELKTHPNDATLLTNIGNVYLAAEQYPSAQKYYQQALALKSTDTNALTQLASSFYYQGDTDKAIATLQQALSASPTSANALFNLGMIKWRAKSDPNGAIELWEKLLKSNPNHPNRAEVERLIAEAKQHLNMPEGKKTDKPAM